MTPTLRSVTACAALVLATACGARSQLLTPEAGAPRPDAADVAPAPDAQPDAGPPPRQYLGTEFWAVPTLNSQLTAGSEFQFAVAVGNPNPVPVDVTITGGALTAPIALTLMPGSTQVATLPWVFALTQNTAAPRTLMAGDACCVEHEDTCCAHASYTGCSDRTLGSALAPGGAYHVVATRAVSAYQFNALEFSSTVCAPSNEYSYTNDASLLLPVAALTGRYLVLAHGAIESESSFVAITATEPGTTVTVQLTARSGTLAGDGVAAQPAGSTHAYTLAHAGDVLQLLSEFDNTGRAIGFDPHDLTGATITASSPVSVVAGTDCSNMSPMGDCPACDHLEQQLFPLETWGRDVVVSQLRDRTAPGATSGLWTTEPFMVRVLSGADGNMITFNPPGVHRALTVARGQWIELCTDRDFEVHSTAPMLVEQYMVGQAVTSCTTCDTDSTINSRGDPSAVLEVPAPQYLARYDFVVPPTYEQNYINVVGTMGADIALDGAPLAGTPDGITGTSWRIWRLPIDAGAHTILARDGRGFGLKVYGVASYTSYAYPGGSNLAIGP